MEIKKATIIAFLKESFILFFSILLLAIIICIRLLRPFVLVRFGTLKSDRIGHYAGNTELYLCEREVGLQPKGSFDIFFNAGVICNYQLKKMLDRTLRVFPIIRLQRSLYTANRMVPGYKKHIISLPSDRDIHDLYARTPAHLSFTLEEEERGDGYLYQMGIPANARFVCFYGRDSKYLNSVFKRDNWDYHNYRDVNINNFIPAVEELVKRGYYAVRMGAIVEKCLETNNHRIIDYAKKCRTDFMDIFLLQKGVFTLGDGSGLTMVPKIFRRPVIETNFIPLEYASTWNSNILIIPKKLWLRKEKRFMTFREILESDTGRFYHAQKYEQAGLEVVENTAEEIRDVTIEMDERLKGSWQTTEEDEELQQRFWALFKKSEFHGVIRARIGRDFLRQNKNLLE